MRHARLALLLPILLIPDAAPAQTAAERALWVPGLSTALADDALAPRRNPAGLGFLDGRELQLLFTGTGPDADAGRSWGGYFGWGLGGLAWGLGMEWLRGDALVDARRTTLTLAAGDDAFGIGTAVRWWQADGDPALDEAITLDVGLSGRVGRHLAWGVAARDLASRSREPELSVGVGLKGFRDRVTLGVDQVWLGEERPFGDDAHTEASLRLALWRGFEVLAGARRRVGDGDTAVQLGMALDLAGLGIYGAQVADGDFGAEGVVGVRLSSARHPSLVEPPALVGVDLTEALAPKKGLAFFGSPRDPFLDLLGLLDRVRRDPVAAGVVITLRGGEPLGLAEAEELRGAVAALRDAGKQTWFYLRGVDDAGYYLASAGEHILAHPAATLQVNGLATTTLYFGEGLSRIGVAPEFVRVGAYKSAPEHLERGEMSEAERESLNAVLDDVWARWRTGVSEDRSLDAGALDRALAPGILDGEQALALGLVDEVAFEDELPERVGAPGRRARILRHYADRQPARDTWGRSPTLAVVRVVGTIVDGPTPTGPLAEGMVGADEVVKALEDAARDPRVKAILLRVDSGGGDAGASDRIWRAVREADAEKPVIASLGATAASGGYYVAAGARRIVADPSTLTGSIGIFAGHVDLSGLLDKLGIGTARLTRGPHPDLFGATAPWSEADRSRMQAWVEAGYRRFLGRVAETRSLSEEEVDAVGRGRVWTGAQARDRGLVDELGSFADAVAAAKAAAGVAPEAVPDVTLYGPVPALAVPFTGEGPPLAGVPAAGLQMLQRARLLDGGRPLALMPWHIEVR